MTVKSNIIELIEKMNESLQAILTLLFCICIYAMINPKALLNPIWEANEPITFAGVLGLGMGLYAIFKLAELARPLEAIKYLFNHTFPKIKPHIPFFSVCLIIIFPIMFSWLYFFGIPPYQLKPSLFVTLLLSPILAGTATWIDIRKSSTNKTEGQ